MADIPDRLLPANQPASSVRVKADPTARPPVPRTLLLWLTYGVAGNALFPIIYVIEGATRPGYAGLFERLATNTDTIWSLVLVARLWVRRSTGV